MKSSCMILSEMVVCSKGYAYMMSCKLLMEFLVGLSHCIYNSMCPEWRICMLNFHMQEIDMKYRSFDMTCFSMMMEDV